MKDLSKRQAVLLISILLVCAGLMTSCGDAVNEELENDEASSQDVEVTAPVETEISLDEIVGLKNSACGTSALSADCQRYSRLVIDYRKKILESTEANPGTWDRGEQ